jgi:hypothetical protein
MRMKFEQFPAVRSPLRLSIIAAIACLLMGAAPLVPLSTSIASQPLAKGIQDNSFFIEEGSVFMAFSQGLNVAPSKAK